MTDKHTTHNNIAPAHIKIRLAFRKITLKMEGMEKNENGSVLVQEKMRTADSKE